jgi:diguanylate cyclase (GGDEF)-like protein
MKKMVRKLGFRLVISSLVVALLTIFVGGYVVFKVSEDSVKQDNLRAASQLVSRFSTLGMFSNSYRDNLKEIIMSVKVERFGSSWIMDNDGFLVAHMDPKYNHFVEEKTFIGDTVIRLQSIEIPVHKLGEKNIIHEARLLDLTEKFDGGFGTYNFLGENKIIAFRVIKDRGWLVAVDQPISTAFSELKRIKKIIFTTSGVVGLLILGFTWFATQLIIRPFYAEVEEMNEKLVLINRELEGSTKNLEKSTASLARLYDLSIAMQYSGFIESHLPLVLGVAQERFALDRILLFMPDEKEEFLRCRASVGNVFEPEEQIMVPIPEGGGALAKSYLEKKTFFFSSDTELSDEFKIIPPYSSIRALRSRSFAVFPLITKDRVIGVFGIDNKLSGRPMTRDEVPPIENFSYKLAAMIENTIHFQTLKKQVEELEKTDKLTELYHLRNFKSIAEEEFARSVKTGNPIAMALLHIVNFKEYNELNGYQRGDYVLQKFSELLKKLEVMKVTLGRCYGATMIALFHNHNYEQAKYLIDQFENDFDQFSFYGEKKLTTSKLMLNTVVEAYPVADLPGFDEFFKSLESEIFKV